MSSNGGQSPAEQKSQADLVRGTTLWPLPSGADVGLDAREEVAEAGRTFTIPRSRSFTPSSIACCICLKETETEAIASFPGPSTCVVKLNSASSEKGSAFCTSES